MRAAALPLLVVTAAASVVPAAAQVSFDRLLAGQDRACTESPDFRAFRQSLVRAAEKPRTPASKPTVPADVAAGIGAVALEEKSDHVVVSVVVDGTFRGLRLSRIVFYFGKQNGIAGHAFEFAAPAEAVKKTFAAAVDAGTRRMAAESEIGAATGLDFTDGRAALWCDFSN